MSSYFLHFPGNRLGILFQLRYTLPGINYIGYTVGLHGHVNFRITMFNDLFEFELFKFLQI